MKGSSLIMPIAAVIHVVIINVTLYSLTPDTYLHPVAILSYNFSWLLVALILNFYSIERKEKFITKFNKFVKHYFIFTLAYISIFSFRGTHFEIVHQFFVLTVLFFLLAIYRWSFFFVRRLYRLEGGNYVNVVAVGCDKNLAKLQKVFSDPDFGYRYKGYFHKERSEYPESYLGPTQDCYNYILNNGIDEIYCMISQLSSNEVQELIHFADNNLKRLKLIPDNKGVFTKAMSAQLFATVPILEVRQFPLEKNYAKYGKRLFDIVFSSLVIVFILSWLIPLLYVITRLESSAPLFFKQQRHGYNKKTFWCYKFRSMTVNREADTKMCVKNDARVTRIGRVLRKTNIDELPQFFNVFLGEMSVVGPRPHMEAHTQQYSQSVDKYLVRHFTKPGITGLAQVKGYRGEIVCPSDIINRTRLDIFYLEKWCLFLDFAIIYQTIKNITRGEEKAF